MQTGIKVCDAMTEKPVTVSSKTSLKECSQLMLKQHVGSLLIKDEKEIRGIITEQDIVRKAVAMGKPATTAVGSIMEEDATMNIGDLDEDDDIEIDIVD